MEYVVQHQLLTHLKPYSFHLRYEFFHLYLALKPAVIGKGGATIREIVEKSGAKVDVNDEGVVTVAAPDEESRNIAMQMIKDITAKAELNKIYSGKVMKIMEFGAFVNFLGKQDGLVHISELADKRVAKVTDVVKEGDEVKVKVIGFDRGKVKLSMKQAAK